MKKKFYRNGLYFRCTGCGECCRLPGGTVEISREEARAIAAHLQLTQDQFLEEYCNVEGKEIRLKDGEGTHCVFLEGDRCRVYQARPVQCRTFPFWPENLKSKQRWESLREFCPGIGIDNFYSADEIEQIRNLQRSKDRHRQHSNEQDKER
ncbi:MAG: YkgJ family cysteine cluster protein [Calditrichia bacterium]